MMVTIGILELFALFTLFCVRLIKQQISRPLECDVCVCGEGEGEAEKEFI